QRAAHPDDAREALRATIPRGDPELHLGLAELGVLARDAEVAGHCQLAAAARRVAVHRRDHRLAPRLEAAQHRLAAQRAGLAVERPRFGEVADVGPRDERL